MKSSRLALSLVVLSVLLGLNGTPAAFADEAKAGGDAPAASDAGSADSAAAGDSPSTGSGDSAASGGDSASTGSTDSASTGSADSASAGSGDSTSSGDAASSGKPTPEEARAAAMNALKQDAKLDARAALVTMTPFKSDKGISFQYPKSWNIEVPTDGGPTLFRAKTMKGIVNFNAILDQIPAGMSLDDYVKMTVEMTPKALAEQKMDVGPLETVEQKTIDIGKQSATKLVINYEFKDIKLKVKTTQVFALTKKGTLYILCFSMPENTYDEYTTLIQQVLDSVKFS